ncbi:MAG: hypothetical protein ABIO41_07750, partial [Ignavibacteria bacterium]
MIKISKKLKLIYFFFIILFVTSTAYTQEIADTKYWIIFNDKGEFKPDGVIENGSIAYTKGKDLLTD